MRMRGLVLAAWKCPWGTTTSCPHRPCLCLWRAGARAEPADGLQGPAAGAFLPRQRHGHAAWVCGPGGTHGPVGVCGRVGAAVGAEGEEASGACQAQLRGGAFSSGVHAPGVTHTILVIFDLQRTWNLPIPRVERLRLSLRARLHVDGQEHQSMSKVLQSTLAMG